MENYLNKVDEISPEISSYEENVEQEYAFDVVESLENQLFNEPIKDDHLIMRKHIFRSNNIGLSVNEYTRVKKVLETKTNLIKQLNFGKYKKYSTSKKSKLFFGRKQSVGSILKHKLTKISQFFELQHGKKTCSHLLQSHKANLGLITENNRMILLDIEQLLSNLKEKIENQDKNLEEANAILATSTMLATKNFEKGIPNIQTIINHKENWFRYCFIIVVCLGSLALLLKLTLK